MDEFGRQRTLSPSPIRAVSRRYVLLLLQSFDHFSRSRSAVLSSFHRFMGSELSYSLRVLLPGAYPRLVTAVP